MLLWSVRVYGVGRCCDLGQGGGRDLGESVAASGLLGSGNVATELDRLDLIDEYVLVPRPPQDRRTRPDPVPERAAQHAMSSSSVSTEPLRNGAVAMRYQRAR